MALANSKSNSERAWLNAQHKKDAQEGKFKTTTKLYDIFRAYCHKEGSWNHDHDRPHRRHELENEGDHHDVCTEPRNVAIGSPG